MKTYCVTSTVLCIDMHDFCHSLADARRIIARLKAMGATNIKLDGKEVK